MTKIHEKEKKKKKEKLEEKRQNINYQNIRIKKEKKKSKKKESKRGRGQADKRKDTQMVGRRHRRRNTTRQRGYGGRQIQDTGADERLKDKGTSMHILIIRRLRKEKTNKDRREKYWT